MSDQRPVLLHLDSTNLQLDELCQELAERLKVIGDQIDSEYADRLLACQRPEQNEHALWVVCKNGLKSCLSAAAFGLMIADRMNTV